MAEQRSTYFRTRGTSRDFGRVRVGSRIRTVLLASFAWALATSFAVGQNVDRPWELRVCADPNAMPLSHRDGTGYENLIAHVIADELGAVVAFDWFPQVVDMINERLRGGHCDVIMGVLDGQEPMLTSVAYYRTPYVFVYREADGIDIESFDDPVLHDLRIAVQASGIPPHQSLVERGLTGNVVAEFATSAYATRADPQARVVESVASGEADVALAWGPIGGYYGARSDEPLIVRPVAPLIDPPLRTMVSAMAVGMRRGDDALRDQIGYAIAERWDEIQAILDEYDVVQQPLSRPTAPRELP